MTGKVEGSGAQGKDSELRQGPPNWVTPNLLTLPSHIAIWKKRGLTSNILQAYSFVTYCNHD